MESQSQFFIEYGDSRSLSPHNSGCGGGGIPKKPADQRNSGSKEGKESKSSFKRRPTIERVTRTESVSSDNSSSNAATNEGIKFPMLKPFAHFHYESADFDTIKAVVDHTNDEDELYCIRVMVNKRSWIVRRGYEHFRILDRQLHTCVFDRNVSQLANLDDYIAASVEDMNKTAVDYIDKLSELSAGILIFCGTVLNFFEVDNRGNKLILCKEDSGINIPAIAAAQVIKPYTSQAPDELTLEVGDMISVIDKPAPEESTWWRGKKSLQVGLFPSECVEVIGGKSQSKTQSEVDGGVQTKPVLRRRGKLITFLRMFFTQRPARTVLKQNGIVKERVFGCDLGEHLSNSCLQIPMVLKCCCQVIEAHGLVDGIYRLSGVASNIQRLRAQFDEGAIETLEDERYLLDLHTITAVLKMYFRELPNPLMTYQLYESFGEAVQSKGEERLSKLKATVTRLPPPHYRSAKHLFRHLNIMSQYQSKTAMDSRNLAIVWSPNLMRCKAMESGNINGATMLYNVSVQATVVEALIAHFDLIFCDDPAPPTYDDVSLSSYRSSDSGSGWDIPDYYVKSATLPRESNSNFIEANKKPRPSSVVISAPSRLLSLSQAQDRQSAGENSSTGGAVDSSDDIIIPVFHTVIEFNDRRRNGGANDSNLQHSHNSVSNEFPATSSIPKDRSPSVWKSFFHRNRHSSGSTSSKKTTATDRESRTSVTPAVVAVDERTKSIEDSQQITDSEIGHLSRRVQPSLSTNYLNQAHLQGSLPSLIDREGSTPNLNDPSSQPDENSSLLRAASHESFFEPTSPVFNSADTLSTESKPKTPGVVFRPAYKKEDLSHLMNANAPKATWKTASSNRFDANTHTLQTNKVVRLPYISPASSMTEDKGKPSSFVQDHATREAANQNSTDAIDHQALYDDSHIYETVGRYKKNPEKSPNQGPGQSESITCQPTAVCDSESGKVEDITTEICEEDLEEEVPVVSAELFQVSQSQPVASTPLKKDYLTTSDGNIDRTQFGWEDSETMMCMNQAQQARLSRNFSLQSSSSDRSRRHLTDTNSEAGIAQLSSPSELPELSGDASTPEPLYANIDPLGVKAISPLNPDIRTTQQNNVTATTSNLTQPKLLYSEANQPRSNSSGYVSEKPRQMSVPKHIPHRSTSLSDDKPSTRPRSNSSPYKPPVLNSRRVETDVDKAISLNNNLITSPAVSQGKITRHMEYVNINKYKGQHSSQSEKFVSREGSSTKNQNSSPDYENLGSLMAQPPENNSMSSDSGSNHSTTERKSIPVPSQRRKTPPPAVPRKPSIPKRSLSEDHSELSRSQAEHHSRLELSYTIPHHTTNQSHITNQQAPDPINQHVNKSPADHVSIQNHVANNRISDTQLPDPLPRRHMLDLL